VTSASPVSSSGRSARATRDVIVFMPPTVVDPVPARQRADPWTCRYSTGV
jgi:hypothetical protein